MRITIPYSEIMTRTRFLDSEIWVERKRSNSKYKTKPLEDCQWFLVWSVAASHPANILAWVMVRPVNNGASFWQTRMLDGNNRNWALEKIAVAYEQWENHPMAVIVRTNLI